VPTNAAIQVTFSGPANAATVNTTNIKLTNASNAAVAGSVTYNATTYAATFTPATALTAGATYTLTVSGVTSSNGAAMASAMTSTFTTASSTYPAATVQYQGTLFPYSGDSGSGQVSVDTTGKVTIQLTGAKDSTTFAAQFCPSYSIYNQQPYACIDLGNVTTGASGTASFTAQFPQAGAWAGEFQLNSGGSPAYETGLVPTADANGVTQVYMSTLEPEKTVNGKGIGTDTGAETQSPLTSGSVTYTASSQTLQFTLKGALPNMAYTSAEDGVLGGSSSYLLYNSQMQSAFTTDSSGNVTFTVLQDGTAGDIFEVAPNNSDAGLIGGFSVPQ
jgi:hypothetical protein